jgi:hypothetical protein
MTITLAYELSLAWSNDLSGLNVVRILQSMTTRKVVPVAAPSLRADKIFWSFLIEIESCNCAISQDAVSIKHSQGSATSMSKLVPSTFPYGNPCNKGSAENNIPLISYALPS